MRKPWNSIAFKSISGSVGLLIVFFVIVCIIGNLQFTDVLMKQYATGAFYTADAAALAVKADHLKMYLDSDHLYLVIADVSGKGIPAALFMMGSRIILAQTVREGKSPAEALESAIV